MATIIGTLTPIVPLLPNTEVVFTRYLPTTNSGKQGQRCAIHNLAGQANQERDTRLAPCAARFSGSAEVEAVTSSFAQLILGESPAGQPL